MTNKERLPYNPEQHEQSREALAAESKINRERIAERLNENLEKSPENNIEKSKHEALEAAKKHEKEQLAQEKAHEKSPAETQPINTKSRRKASFNQEMTRVQSNLSPASRAFSKVIHNPAIEKASDVVGGTIARPNAILSGAVMAFILTLGVYIIARFFGYPLSGSETLVAFAVGWVLGCMYDFFRVMITGKKV